MYEEFFRGTIRDAIAHYQVNPPRGEIVLVISGAPPEDDAPWDEATVREMLFERLDAGETLSSAAKTVAGLANWNRREVYALGANRKN
jgi:16S rRNA (cytidine1402-2'-O)-methyltransferase